LSTCTIFEVTVEIGVGRKVNEPGEGSACLYGELLDGVLAGRRNERQIIRWGSTTPCKLEWLTFNDIRRAIDGQPHNIGNERNKRDGSGEEFHFCIKEWDG